MRKTLGIVTAACLLAGAAAAPVGADHGDDFAAAPPAQAGKTVTADLAPGRCADHWRLRVGIGDEIVATVSSAARLTFSFARGDRSQVTLKPELRGRATFRRVAYSSREQLIGVRKADPTCASFVRYTLAVRVRERLWLGLSARRLDRARLRVDVAFARRGALVAVEVGRTLRRVRVGADGRAHLVVTAGAGERVVRARFAGDRTTRPVARAIRVAARR